MISFQPPNVDSVSIASAISRLRTVDPDGAMVQAARALGISFGDQPAGESPFTACPAGDNHKPEGAELIGAATT